MSVVITYPVASPTTTLTLRSSFAAITNPQVSLMQIVHIAQGGQAFVFTQGSTPVRNRVLPLELRSLPEATGGGFTGWAAVLAFVLDTLQGSTQPCRVTDPDGDSYVVRYLRGLDSMVEVQQGRFSGVLTFREDI